MSLKTITLLAQLILPSPDNPKVQEAFRQMTTDYATCAAYYNFKAAYYTISSPTLHINALGGIANAGYEGHRVEALANLPTGTYEARIKAASADMQKTMDTANFAQLYSIYDGFCEDLREDPGKAFILRLKPYKPAPPMK